MTNKTIDPKLLTPYEHLFLGSTMLKDSNYLQNPHIPLAVQDGEDISVINKRRIEMEKFLTYLGAWRDSSGEMPGKNILALLSSLDLESGKATSNPIPLTKGLSPVKKLEELAITPPKT